MIPLQWLKPPKKIAAVPLRLQQRRIDESQWQTNKKKAAVPLNAMISNFSILSLLLVLGLLLWQTSPGPGPALGFLPGTNAWPPLPIRAMETFCWWWQLEGGPGIYMWSYRITSWIPTSRRIRSRRRTGQRIRSRRRTGRRIRSWRRTGRRIRSCRQASRSHPAQMNNTVPQTQLFCKYITLPLDPKTSEIVILHAPYFFNMLTHCFWIIPSIGKIIIKSKI